MKYGVDVASMRLDDLDRRVLMWVEELVQAGQVPKVLDVGAGLGGLSVALAGVGAEVYALDIQDYSADVSARVGQQVQSNKVTMVTADIRTWLPANTKTFDLVVMQRVLHYLPYTDAVTVLRQLRQRTHRLYLSVTGITTAIATHYLAPSLPIESRFAQLDSAGQELFSITAPLCLYSVDELRTLLEETGWQVIWSRVSDFGNIKVEGY